MSTDIAERYVVRDIRADEWPTVKALRLDALRDPVARLAFLETYEDAIARPDAFWQERAARSADGAGTVRQFVAVAPDGVWAGTLTVLMEEAGTEAGTKDWAGYPVERRQGHAVGVFIRPEHRGHGLIEALFAVGLEWAWKHGATRVRLLVHEDNGRAQGAYRKAGFAPSGVTVELAEGGGRELELAVERG
ncbi:GNAT family N-acetyltransferase [Streptomyces sp. NPDC001508]|uniref:GNAT family N-acetyltransferase n=1 Tax=Streptomyces sp. NPDC001508 TaxID=3154656 RepID=UPI00333062F4